MTKILYRLRMTAIHYLTDVNLSQVNPKFGVRAEVIDGLVLRGAVFRTSKRNFVSDQTLEPTTIAGFAQFRDDFDRTDAWTVAAGADLRVARQLLAGRGISLSFA